MMMQHHSDPLATLSELTHAATHKWSLEDCTSGLLRKLRARIARFSRYDYWSIAVLAILVIDLVHLLTH